MPPDGRAVSDSATHPRQWGQFTLKSLVMLVVVSSVIFSWLRQWLPPRQFTVPARLTVSIHLTPDRTLVFDGHEGPLVDQASAVQRVVSAAKDTGAIPHVLIVADSKALFTDVQEVIKIVQQAGAQEIAFRSPGTLPNVR